jgi:hypothetical protein
MGPFLKELVKRKRFGFVTVAGGGRRTAFGFVGRGDSCTLIAVSLSGYVSVVVASLREVAIVLV